MKKGKMHLIGAPADEGKHGHSTRILAKVTCLTCLRWRAGLWHGIHIKNSGIAPLKRRNYVRGLILLGFGPDKLLR